jgi:hypothetical protein
MGWALLPAGVYITHITHGRHCLVCGTELPGVYGTVSSVTHTGTHTVTHGLLGAAGHRECTVCPSHSLDPTDCLNRTCRPSQPSGSPQQGTTHLKRLAKRRLWRRNKVPVVQICKHGHNHLAVKPVSNTAVARDRISKVLHFERAFEAAAKETTWVMACSALPCGAKGSHMRAAGCQVL